MKLMRALLEVSAVCRGVSDYFGSQAKEFQSFSEVKTGEEVATAIGLTEQKATEKAESLDRQRALLEKYHQTMTLVNASYNFAPTRPPIGRVNN